MTTHTVIDNGVEQAVTAEQATRLVDAHMIYECPECEGIGQGEKIYHVSADSDTDDVDVLLARLSN